MKTTTCSYSELVKEIAEEPNYDAALAVEVTVSTYDCRLAVTSYDDDCGLALVRCFYLSVSGYKQPVTKIKS